MWKNLALIPAALLFGFIVLEALARLWMPLPDPYPVDPGLLVLDQRGYWVPEPGYRGEMDNRVDYRNKVVTIDTDGTRTVDCRPAAAQVQEQHAPRVFVLGDSQTFGFGLADGEAWPSRLQCGAAAEARVYNMGVHGTNIDQYVQRGLRQLGALVRPGDTVVVGVTWNDLITPPVANRLELTRGTAAQLAPAQAEQKEEPRVRLRLPVQHLAGETWRYRFYRWSGIFVPSFGSVKDFAESLPFSSVLAGLAVPRLRLLYYRLRDKDSFVHKLDPATVADNMELLSILNRALGDRGATMVVYLLPNRLFFDTAYYDAYSAGGTGFPERDYMSYLTRPFCADLAIRCISAFETLETDVTDRYTFAFDGHYNEAGAARVAARIGDYLTRDCVAGGTPCLSSEVQ